MQKYFWKIILLYKEKQNNNKKSANVKVWYQQRNDGSHTWVARNSKSALITRIYVQNINNATNSKVTENLFL